MLMSILPAARVRAASSSQANTRIDEEMETIVRRCAESTSKINWRLRELEQEWDIERTLEANASTLALSGVLLGAVVDRRWLWLPGVVATFLLQHALQGWCPPVEIFRRLGVRTRREIDTEKYALKALRGDFADIDQAQDAAGRAQRALAAARKDGAGSD